MIRIKEMDKSTVEKAFKNDQLDQLIRDSYKTNGTSGYCKMFCDKNIKINKTYIKYLKCVNFYIS
jgi:hypothetical protein